MSKRFRRFKCYDLESSLAVTIERDGSVEFLSPQGRLVTKGVWDGEKITIHTSAHPEVLAPGLLEKVIAAYYHSSPDRLNYLLQELRKAEGQEHENVPQKEDNTKEEA